MTGQGGSIMAHNGMHGLRPTLLSTALLIIAGPALAQDAEVAELVTPDSFLSAGIGAWSDDRPQQGIYDGMREQGGYLLLDGRYLSRDNATGTWIGLTGRNLGLDTRELRAEWLRQGNVGAFVEYSRIPRDNPYTFRTGLQGIGTTSLTISGAGAAALPFRDVELGTVRDQITAGFYKALSRTLNLKVSLRHEEKEGTRNWGLGSAPLFMVEPIDSTTDQLEATLNYVGERLQLSGGYYGSFYETTNTLIFGLRNGVATPGTVGSPNPTPLSQPLPNQAHQLFLDGGYSLTPTTRTTFKLSRSVATQNERLPTWDLAAPNAPFVGMPSHLNGRMDTTHAELGLTLRPLAGLSMLANLRYHDVNDKTPLLGVVGSNVTGVVTVHNTPQSYETATGRLEATYRLPAGYSVSGGAEAKQQNRFAPSFVNEIFVPYRVRLDEDTYRVGLRRGLSETVNGSLTFLHSKRDGSTLTPTEDFASDLISPIHIADRERDKWRAMLDWTPAERLTLQLALEQAEDDYSDERRYGLKDGRASLVSLDATYSVTDNWQLSGWYARDEARARQFNAQWSGAGVHQLDREANLEDKGDTVGLELRGRLSSALKLGAGALYAKSVSKYQDSITFVGAPVALPVETPLPDITNRLARLGVFAEYALRKTSSVRLDLVREEWRTDDWTWQFADGSPFVYGSGLAAAADGTFVVPNQRQNSTFAGLRYIERF
jgi:MtrB/PioB family decaheme-associated outer membrane protein